MNDKLKINFKGIKLKSFQKEIYNECINGDSKYICITMARQCGKSVILKLMSIQWLLGKEKLSIIYVTKNYLLAKRFYQDIIQILPNELIAQSNGSDLQIRSINGSTLYFYSAESGNSIRGVTAHIALYDEFAWWNFNLPDGTHMYHDVLFPVTQAVGKKVIFCSTPNGKIGNAFYEVYQNGLNPDMPQWKTYHYNIYNDETKSEDEIEDIRKSIPEFSWKVEYLTEFLDHTENTVFSNFESCFNQTIFIDSEQIFVGIDLSSVGTDNTVISLINSQKQTKQFIIDTNDFEQKYNQIASIINSYNNIKSVYVETNGIGSVMLNEIKKKINRKSIIHEWTTTNSNKSDMVNAVAKLIQNNEITFEPNNYQLYDELSTFGYNITSSNKIQYKGMYNTHDDTVMALLISVKCMQDDKKPFERKSFMMQPNLYNTIQ